MPNPDEAVVVPRAKVDQADKAAAKAAVKADEVVAPSLGSSSS